MDWYDKLRDRREASAPPMARRREQASFKETIIEGESSYTHVGNYEKRRR
jgi:hypothetical protein